jgi:DivIVA domain-containing protein
MWLAVVGLSKAAPHPTLNVVTADGIDPVGHERTLSPVADRTGTPAEALWIALAALASDVMSAPRWTAQDVRYATFGKPPWGKRGYNEDEVDDFLEQLEATIASLNDRT